MAEDSAELVNKPFKFWVDCYGWQMQTVQAQDIATEVLLWLCAQEDLLGVFLAATGADVDALRAALQGGAPDAGLGGAALDFVMMRDETALEAAAALDLPPERLTMAHAVLTGDAGMHWT
ncbi:MAG: Protein of unknown function (DUF3572) [Roseibaca calidilacus]|uniref:DUF3572 domain-containing protein n=2 Tax=Roseibaca calidilacus TaxID=1666912 RepID=A0A0P7W9W2_9RHOB|nr:MAG: Protein of unknown function (DUF3572) [Roseibaca calidilacus]CUX83884.1 Protein of unknown function (DUF3572) [Roseibaca calidilacus]